MLLLLLLLVLLLLCCGASANGGGLCVEAPTSLHLHILGLPQYVGMHSQRIWEYIPIYWCNVHGDAFHWIFNTICSLLDTNMATNGCVGIPHV
jgi:hypothetical protein